MARCHVAICAFTVALTPLLLLIRVDDLLYAMRAVRRVLRYSYGAVLHTRADMHAASKEFDCVDTAAARCAIATRRSLMLLALPWLMHCCLRCRLPRLPRLRRTVRHYDVMPRRAAGAPGACCDSAARFC